MFFLVFFSSEARSKEESVRERVNRAHTDLEETQKTFEDTEANIICDSPLKWGSMIGSNWNILNVAQKY